MTIERMEEILMTYYNVSEETIRIVAAIKGYNEESMEAILYVVAGYRSFDQIED